MTEHNYQFTDTNPFTGINYYRLRTVDFSDVLEISKIISVAFFTKTNGEIFPNPTYETLTIKIGSPTKGNPFIIARTNDPIDKTVQFDSSGQVLATPINPYALTFDPSYVLLRGFAENMRTWIAKLRV